MAADLVVYRIAPDWNDWQALLLDAPFESSLHDLIDFDGTSRSAEWTARLPRFVIDPPERPRPTCWPVVSSASLGLGRDAVDLLDPFIEESGELLWTTVEDLEIAVLNVTPVRACLDVTQSRLTGGRFRFAFQPSEIPVGRVFKVPQTSRADVLYCEASPSTGVSLRTLIEGQEITGISLSTLWDSSNGPHEEMPTW